MTTYLTYRDGAGPIEARVKAAVADFYQARQVLPSTVVVHPTEVDAARVAVEVLALCVPVESTGGCLIPEVWLGVAEVEEVVR